MHNLKEQTALAEVVIKHSRPRTGFCVCVCGTGECTRFNKIHFCGFVPPPALRPTLWSSEVSISTSSGNEVRGQRSLQTIDGTNISVTLSSGRKLRLSRTICRGQRANPLPAPAFIGWMDVSVRTEEAGTKHTFLHCCFVSVGFLSFASILFYTFVYSYETMMVCTFLICSYFSHNRGMYSINCACCHSYWLVFSSVTPKIIQHVWDLLSVWVWTR